MYNRYKEKKLFKLFFMNPLIHLFLFFISLIVLIVNIVLAIYNPNQNNTNIIIFFSFLSIIFIYSFLSLNKYYELIAKYYGSKYVLNFLGAQKKRLFFSLTYYYKNKKNIITEYYEIFNFINLNNFFWSINKYSNSVLYVKQWMNNIVYILISGVIVGVIYTILKNNGINITSFSFLIDFSIFFIVPMIFVYIICSFLQGFAGYKFYKEELINKKTFLISCIPIANLFSFMFL